MLLVCVFSILFIEEAHAELCYAESLLQWVFLAVLQDEKLVTLIKSSIKLRECYKCYRFALTSLPY